MDHHPLCTFFFSFFAVIFKLCCIQRPVIAATLQRFSFHFTPVSIVISSIVVIELAPGFVVVFTQVDQTYPISTVCWLFLMQSFCMQISFSLKLWKLFKSLEIHLRLIPIIFYNFKDVFNFFFLAIDLFFYCYCTFQVPSPEINWMEVWKITVLGPDSEI